MFVEQESIDEGTKVLQGAHGFPVEDQSIRKVGETDPITHLLICLSTNLQFLTTYWNGMEKLT